MKNKILFLFLLSFVTIFSQNNNLTHTLSAKEKELLNNQNRSFTETAPPTGDLRNIAEWETMESVIIAYTGDFGIPLFMIVEMAEETNITTIVANLTEENTVRNIYSNNGIDLNRCDFVYQDPDSHWTRDYSPWYISVDNEEVAIINFPYNRPRPNDDDVPILLANELGVDLYGMNVTHTGGNIMCDGYGVAVSTDLVWEENTDKTHAEIDQKMLDYLGIENYHVTIDPIDEYIKHIDCWGKFLDVDKIIITEVPTSDYRYDDYEFIANYFANLDCPWGYPYEVIRVQAATYSDFDVNPYVNSLFLNNKIFVPQTGSNLDDDAITVYQNSMPGYEIIGVDYPFWYNTDALHCRTHGVPDREMLFIKHFPLFDEVTFQENFTIEANVYSYSNQTNVSEVKLFYRHNNDVWEEVAMNNTSGSIYNANIPALSGNNDVEYYIYAKDNQNKTESLPRFGELDAFNFSYNNNAVSLNDYELNNITIIPNPNSGLFSIETSMPIKSIQLYDINGKIVYSNNTTNNNQVDASHLTNGIYFIKIESDSNIIYKKISIK